MQIINSLFTKRSYQKGDMPSIGNIKEKNIKFMEFNMQFIYIENYLSIKKEEKMSFFKFINGSDKFKITNQKVILSDDSIILELSPESKAPIVKAYVDSFFKNDQHIDAHIVNKIVKNDSDLVLTFKDSQEKKIHI